MNRLQRYSHTSLELSGDTTKSRWATIQVRILYLSSIKYGWYFFAILVEFDLTWQGLSSIQQRVEFRTHSRCPVH